MNTIFHSPQDNHLEHFNTIGLLFQNRIYLNKNDELVQFDISEIRRIYFKKQRNIKNNSFLFMLSCIFATATVFLEKYLEQNYKLPLFLFSGMLLVYSLVKKSYRYEIFLITSNHNFTSIHVNAACKDQACELISLIKRKIKKNKQYQQAS
ncbi:hypothetical protein [Flavobacterium phycosphaerae]|uniref:hypothetical protein n=1 Tax=Flavobacterium phycosphaerae TaxID=2697515 RepID=UPI001389AB07|nr:hypothetical protein [Flavobacterium phycosphaerae]